jgi:hypothetical protein
LELERNQTQSPPSLLLPPHSPFTRLLNKLWQQFFFLSESQHDGKKFLQSSNSSLNIPSSPGVESLNPIPAVNIKFEEGLGFGTRKEDEEEEEEEGC